GDPRRRAQGVFVCKAVRSGLDFRQDRARTLSRSGQVTRIAPMTTATTKLKLDTMLGNYPITKALRSDEVKSDLIDFDFAEVKVANTMFKKVVRETAYDVAELAIVTYLQAKTYGKPYVLLPAVIVSRGQHHTIAYNPQRGALKPSELTGKRVGVRA